MAKPPNVTPDAFKFAMELTKHANADRMQYICRMATASVKCLEAKAVGHIVEVPRLSGVDVIWVGLTHVIGSTNIVASPGSLTPCIAA